MINPIEHARTKEEANKYKVEPYVVPGDVYGVGNLAGRGGWTWYTGSSAWLYRAGIEAILGLNIQNNELTLNPNIPASWKEYWIKYRYKGSIYNIKIHNVNGKMSGISRFKLDGREIEEKRVKLEENGTNHEIDIEM